MDNTKRIVYAEDVLARLKRDKAYMSDVGYIHAKSAVNSAPTAEVGHGRWKKNWHDNNLIGHEYEECSICGCMISDTEKFWDCNYCPNCGTKMDLEEIL